MATVIEEKNILEGGSQHGVGSRLASDLIAKEGDGQPIVVRRQGPYDRGGGRVSMTIIPTGVCSYRVAFAVR